MESKSIFELSTSVDDAIIRNSTISPKKLEALSLEISELCAQSKANEALSYLMERAAMVLKCEDVPATKSSDLFDATEARRISSFLLRPQNNPVPNVDRKLKPDFSQLFLPLTTAMKSNAIDSDDTLNAHIQSVPYLRPKAVIHDATDVPSVPTVGNNVNLHMINNPKFNKKKPAEKGKAPITATVSAVDVKEDIKDIKKDKNSSVVSYTTLPTGSNLSAYVEYVLENRSLLSNLLLVKILLCYYAAHDRSPYLSDTLGSSALVGGSVDVSIDESKLAEYTTALSVTSILDSRDLRVVNDVIKDVEHLATMISPPHVLLLSGSSPTMVSQYEVSGRATAVMSNISIRPSTVKSGDNSSSSSPESKKTDEEQELYYFEVTLKASGGSPRSAGASIFQDFRVGLAACGTSTGSQLSSSGPSGPGVSLSRTASSTSSSTAGQLTGFNETSWVFDIDNQHFFHDSARLAKERKDSAASTPKARLSRQVSDSSTNDEDLFFFDMFQQVVDAAPAIPDLEGDRAESTELSALVATSEGESLSSNLYSCLFDGSPPRASSAHAVPSAAAGAPITRTASNSDAQNTPVTTTPANNTSSPTPVPLSPRFSAAAGIAEEGSATSSSSGAEDTFASSLRRMLAARGVTESDDPPSGSLFDQMGGPTGRGEPVDANLPSDLRAALSKSFSLPPDIATLKQSPFASSFKKKTPVASSLDKYAAAFQSGGNPLSRSSAEMTEGKYSPMNVLLADGTVVGCLFNLKTGELKYFINGLYVGTAPVTITSASFKSFATNGVTPIVSNSNAAVGFEINIGQSPFRYSDVVSGAQSTQKPGEPGVKSPAASAASSLVSAAISAATKRKQASSTVDVSKDVKEGQTPSIAVMTAKRCSYMTFTQSGSVLSQLSDSSVPSSANKGSGIVLSNLTSDAFKTVTFECTVRLATEEQRGGRSSAAYTLFHSCGSSSCSSVISTSVDGGCRMGVNTNGSLYFEMNGYNAVQTTQCPIVAGLWHHISIVYTFHRSTNKSTVSFHHNGQLVACHDVVSDSKSTTSISSSKVGKILPRTVCIGGLLGTNRYTLASSSKGWEGDVAEARVWVSSRSESEIAQSLGRSRMLPFFNDSELLFCVSFEEGCGKTLHDNSVKVGGIVSTRATETIILCGSYSWCSLPASAVSLDSLTISEILSKKDSKDFKELPKEFKTTLDVPAKIDRSIRALLSSVVQSIDSSKDKYLHDFTDQKSGDLSVLRQLQYALPSSLAATIDPSEVNLLMVNSVLRQCIGLISLKCTNSILPSESDMLLLVSVCLSMINALRVNLVAIYESLSTGTSSSSAGANLNFSAAKYDQIGASNKSELSTKILISLLALISGIPIHPMHKSALRKHLLSLRSAALEVLACAIDLLVPTANNQMFLIECLFLKKYRLLYESRTEKRTAPVLFSEVLSLLPVSEGEYFHPSKPSLNLPCDAVVAVLNLSEEGNAALFDTLSQLFSQKHRACELLPRRFWPVYKIDDFGPYTSGKAFNDVAYLMPRPGDVVMRGPHWRYGDQDGGVGSVGTVVEVVSWLDQVDRGVVIEWHNNGRINSYRYGVSDSGFVGPANEKGSFSLEKADKLIYDVSIMLPASVNIESIDNSVSESSVGKSSPSPKGKGETEYVRKILDYTPTEVRVALSTGDELKGNTANPSSASGVPAKQLTKRLVLLYMKSHSPPEWQEKHKLMRSLNSLIVKLNINEVIAIYNDFFSDFSAVSEKSFVGGSKGGKEKTRFLPLEPRGKNFDGEGQFENRLLVLLSCLIKESCDSPSDASVRLLLTLQGFLTGAFSSRYDKTKDLKFDVPDSQLFDAPFKCKNGSLLAWDWSKGIWSSASAVSTIGSTVGQVETTEKTVDQDSVKVLAEFVVDRLSIPDHIDTVVNDGSFDIVQNSDRSYEQQHEDGNEWNSFIANNCAMPPNTGTYKWFLTMKNVHNGKNQNRIRHSLSSGSVCMVGVSTVSFSPDDFIGADGESWAISTNNFDLFHAGRKKRSAPSNLNNAVVGRSLRKHSVHDGTTIIAVTVDTDKGSVNFKVYSNDDNDTPLSLNYDNLSGKTVYPAFSLYTPGDCISIFTGAGQINTLLNHEGSGASLLTKLDCKNCPSVVISQPKSRPVCIGAPQPVLVSFALELLRHTTETLSSLSEHRMTSNDEPTVQDDPVSGVCLVQIMGCLFKFDHHATNRQVELVEACSNLLAMIKNTIHIFYPGPPSLEVDAGFSQKTISTVATISDCPQKNSSYELLTQLSCIVSAFINSLARYTVSRGSSDAIDNQVLAKQKLSYKSFMAPGHSLYTVSNECFKYDSVTGLKSAKSIDKAGSHTNAWFGLAPQLLSQGFRLVPQITSIPDGSSGAVSVIVNEILLSIYRGVKSVDSFMQWIALHDKTHKNYSRLGGDELNVAVRTIFVASIYHLGCTQALCYCYNAFMDHLKSMRGIPDEQDLMAFKPPFYISSCYEHAMKVRVWARDTAKDHGLSLEYLGQRIVYRSLFLFELEPCGGELQFVPITSKETFLTWLAAQTSASGDKKLSNLLLAIKSFIIDSSSLDHIRACFGTTIIRANQRLFGLRSLKKCLEAVPTEIGDGVKISLFYQILLRNPGSSDMLKSHYLLNLDHLCKKIKSEVQLGFHSLFTAWTEELSEASQELHGYAEDGSSAECSPYALCILNCCGVSLSEDDHTLLCDINFFNALEELINSCAADKEHISSPVPNESTSPVKSSGLSSKIMKVALKLFIFIALQVAATSENVAVNDKFSLIASNTNKNSLPVPLKRIKSGLDSLSKSVFDILYTQLNNVIVAVTSAVSHSKKNVPDIIYVSCSAALVLNETTMLLMHVSSNASCQQIMIKPKWLLLLLKMSSVKHSTTQHRALLLLREILPLVTLSKNSIAGMNRSELVEVLHVQDSQHSIAELIVLHVIELVGRTLLGSYYQGSQLVLSEDADRLRELAEYSLPLISEGIALCRFLYCDSQWHPIVHGLLVNCLTRGIEMVCHSGEVDQSKCSTLLSTLSILGGHIDALYRSCLVKFEHPHSNKTDVLGTFVDFNDSSLDRLIINAVGCTDSSTNIALIVNAEKVTPINRCSSDKLVLTSDIVSNLIRLTDTLVSSSNQSVIKEDNGSVFCCLVSDVRSLLSTSCCRVLSNLAARLKSAAISLREILKYTDDSTALILQLLDLSQTPTKAAGLPDIPVYEEYLLNLLQQRQKLHLQSSQKPKSVESAIVKAEKPELKSETNVIDGTSSSVSEIGAHAQILKHILELQRQHSGRGLPRGTNDPENRAENWTNIWATEPESSAGSISDLERTLGSSTLSDTNNNANTAQVLNILSNSVDYNAGETTDGNNGNGSEYGEYEEEGGGAVEEHQQLVQTLEAMGFPAENASIALDMCGDDIDEALNYILNNAAQLDDMVASHRLARQVAADRKETVRAPAPDTVQRSPARQRASSSAGDAQTKAVHDVPSANYYTSEEYTQFIPFFAVPGMDTERVGGVAPNENLKVLEEVVAECEQEFDDHTSKVWYKLNLNSIRDGNCQKLPSALSEISSSASSGPVFVYIPKYYKSVQVVKTGVKPISGAALSSTPGLTMSINRVYMVIGNNGALVRESCELSSRELTTLPSGGLVQAVEETFNSEGTLRMRIVSPVSGWISKLANLVALVSSSNSAFVRLTEEEYDNEYDQQRALIEDKFEFNLQSTENFLKEERFFGSKQGLQFEKHISANDIGPSGASVASATLSGRRSRITGSTSLSGMASALSGLSAKAVDDMIGDVLTVLKKLYCRKLLTSLVLTSIAPSSDDSSSELPELFKRILRSASFPEEALSITSMQWFPNYKYLSGKGKLPKVDEGRELLDKFVNYVRLLVFRGDPYTRSGLEALALSNVSVACALAEANQSVTMESVMESVVCRLLLLGGEELSHRLSGLLIEALMRNVKLVCTDMFSDHCWADACYDEDLDDELIPRDPNSVNDGSGKPRLEMQPSTHYMTWLTHILLRVNDVPVTMQLFKCWALALRGASLSLKVCVFDALIAILSTINGHVVAHDNALPSPVPVNHVECDHLRLLKECLALLPVNQLNLVAQRRLWFEMEDSPMYSRFLQALLELVSIIDISTRIIDEHSSTVCIGSQSSSVSGKRSVIQFTSSVGSYLQLPKTRDQSGSWTLECWVKLLPSNAEAGMEPLQPIYLMSSSRGCILLRNGGKVLSNEQLSGGETELQGAYCVSVHSTGSSANVFDYRVVEGRWTHFAIVFDSNASRIALHIDGEFVDGIVVSNSLQVPLGAIGYNFNGQLAGMRIFTSAKSNLEIKRDMRSSITRRSDLLFNIHCNEGVGTSTYDTAEVFNSTVGLVNCEWVQVSDAFVPEELNESEKSDFVELSGILKFSSVPGANEDDAFAKDSSEVVNVRYRVVSANEFGFEQISGSLEWCEKEVLSSIEGTLDPSTGAIRFTVDPLSTVVGPPETLNSWLVRFTFEGKIVNKSELDGICHVEALINGLPELTSGGTRIDRLALLTNECISYSTNTESYSGGVSEVITVNDSVEETGKYIATVEIRPTRGENEVQYGIQGNQGQFFFEWQINTNASDSIVFGLCTSNAFDHPDSSVEVNDLTWVYSVAGQASHGFSELSECEAASDGDVISVQIDTENSSGIVRYFKNYELLVQFENVFSNLVIVNADVEASLKGLRPFVCLASAKDSVSFLGNKADGEIDIFYGESDEHQRTQFTGTLLKGALTGYASLGIRRENSSIVDYWFGMWDNNARVGYHILMRNDCETSDEIPSADNAAEETDHLPSIEGASEIDVTPCKIAYYDKGVLTLSWNEGCEQSLAESPELKESVAVIQAAYKDFVSPLSGLDVSGEGASVTDVIDLTNKDSSESNDETTLTFSLHNNTSDSSSDTQQYKVNRADPLSVAFNHYVNAKFPGKNSSQFVFTYEDRPVLGSDLPETHSLIDGEVIDVSVASLNSSIATEEQIDEFVARSAARYVIQVIYPAGATVRGTIEIEDSQPWRTVGYCTILEAFDRKITQEGIARFQLADGGWLSERLRGGTEAQVIQILKHNHVEPLKFKVIRADGAKIRSTSDLESSVVGHCPVDTVVTVRVSQWVVDELDDGNDEDQDDKLSNRKFVHRVKIDEPVEYVGWISNKENIVQAIGDGCDTTKVHNANNSVADPDVRAELNRRSAAESRRKERETQSVQHAKKLKNKRHVTIESTLTASQNTFFLLNKSKSGSTTCLQVSDDCSTVTCVDSSAGKVMVLGSRGFTSGVHYWEVLVNAASWGGVFIGVSVGDTSGWNGYGLLNYRATQCYGSETLYGSYYAVGDKVGVLLDMNRGTISFFKDGEDFNIGKANVINMGVAYHELRRQTSSRGSYRSSYSSSLGNEIKFYPCLGLRSSGDSLSIFNSHWFSQKGENPSAFMSGVTESRHFLHQWLASYEMTSKQWLSSSLVDTLYDAYINAKRSKDFVHVLCRAGLTVTVNVNNDELLKIVDPELTKQYKISVGASVRTQYGSAHIIGTVNGTQVWYNYRGTSSNKESNWYWNASELTDLINCGTIGFEEIEKASSDDSAGPSVLVVPPAVAMSRLSSDCIHQSLFDCHWTQDEDEVLVPVINAIASKNELNPFEIPLTEFPDLVKAQLQFSSLACRESLKSKSDTDILVRYMALCQLNKAVNMILPFVDLNSGDNRDRLMRTDIASFAHLNQLSDQNRQYYTASRALKLLKGVIFTNVKMVMWSATLAESTTKTGAPADEYERPDDLTEIVINRMEARNMEKVKDVTPFAERLRVSVFGQLFNHMRSSHHFRDDSALRRSFVHIQDGNQSRAFYVKFLGEGVDDNGGPYRAVFQSAIGEEITSLLDLVLPCPNAVGEVGENRDKYVLNTNLLLNAEEVAPGLGVFSSVSMLFIHLGRLIGLACRQGILSPLSLSSLVWKSLAGDVVSVQDLAAIDSSLINSLKYIMSSDGTFEAESHEQELLMHALQVAVSKHISASALCHSPVVDALQECLTQLIKNGGSSLSSLVDLIEQLHLTSEAAVMRLVYRGLSASLPVELMSIFTSGELEVLFCGEAQVDTQTLRRAVVYEDGVSPTDSHIEYFWSCLDELTSEERAQFVNFCSGRSRLPQAASDFPMPFKLVGPPTHSEKNPDNYLPIARTCFFTLSLPKYSSKEVCLEKLKYAIRNTELMDADFIDRKGTQGWDNIR